MATTQYVMFGKAKAGELKGLGRVDAIAKSRVTPFLDMPRPQDMTPRALHAHLLGVTEKISKWWGPASLFVDHFDIPLNVCAPGGRHPVDITFTALQKAGVAAIPVYGFDRDEAYFESIAAIQPRLGTGLCLRLLEDDMENPSQMARAISNALTHLSLTPKSVDVVLDFRSLIQKQLPTLVARGLNSITAIQELGQFRSIIVAGSNFPRSVVDIPLDDVGYVERRELQVWDSIRTALQGRAQLRFWDYSIVHSDFVDVENARNANAKIRYTTDVAWMISRGHMLREQPGYRQYHELARRVANSTEFMGADYSWGDQYIQACADGNDGPGNLAKWVEVDVCHHVSFVTQEITERVPAPA